MKNEMLIVFTTLSDKIKAESLARQIIEAELAACVQVLPQIKSFYFWENKICEDAECLLLIKTLSEKYVELEQFIKARHGYDVPEVIAVKAENISSEYLVWMENFLK